MLLVTSYSPALRICVFESLFLIDSNSTFGDYMSSIVDYSSVFSWRSLFMGFFQLSGVYAAET